MNKWINKRFQGEGLPAREFVVIKNQDKVYCPSCDYNLHEKSNINFCPICGQMLKFKNEGAN